MFITPEEWTAPASESSIATLERDNPFAFHPIANLRLLGVPAHLARAVQEAPSFAAIAEIEGLPARALEHLENIYTHPDLQQVLFDPAQMALRDTLDRLDGFCKGHIRRLMLNLSPEQQACLERVRGGLSLLRGTAGSGKTTIGIYHALRRAQAGRRVLLLTYNVTLAEGLRSLIVELEGAVPATLTVKTVDNFLRAVAAPHLSTQVEYAQVTLDALLQEAIQEVAGAADLAARDGGNFFRVEIDHFIKALGMRATEDYLTIERRGRGAALGGQQRQIVWQTYLAYQRRLAARQLRDGNDTALFVAHAPPGLLDAWRYDDIIVDETQDFTLIKLLAVFRCARPATADAAESPTTLLLTDAAQTIYTRGVFWQEPDLPPVHKLFLRRSYRNSRQIAAAAAALLQHNTLRARENDTLTTERPSHVGLPPIIVGCASPVAQTDWIARRIMDLCADQVFRYADFAILCRTRKDIDRATATLNGLGVPVIEPRQRMELLENTVKALTFPAAKGLEFPVVFVYGLDFGQSPNYAVIKDLQGEDLQRATEQERALLYVAMTRAAEQLYLLTTRGKESPFLAELGATASREMA